MQVSVLEASRLAYEFGIITLRQEMRHLDQEEEGLVFESIDVFASTCVYRPTPRLLLQFGLRLYLRQSRGEGEENNRSSGLPSSETLFSWVLLRARRNRKHMAVHNHGHSSLFLPLQ